MAISNRDRVGKGLETLAAGLEPFVDEAMSDAAPAGRDWLEVLAARDEAKQGAAKSYSKQDPRLLLRVLTEEWRVFKDKLSRAEQSFATELRDVGNKWAHNAAFSPDDTYRALDTMERLLVAAGVAQHAEQIRKLRLDHQRAQYETETRKASKPSLPDVPGTGLKPWREVVTPHEDVAADRYDAAEFAADLHMVATGSTDVGPEYRDPVQFFQRTYLTEGLRDLVDRAARRITGDMNASPIINLQTNFGGGKTHSMLALHHLCSGTPVTDLPQEVQDTLDDVALPDPGQVRRVALVGTRLMPAPGQTSVKDDGTEVRTMWGELAWQLGGREAYDMVAEADRTSTNPGTALHELISAYAPCLILIDEWVAYARQLYGRDDLPGGTFDTQFTFAQTLTETVKSIKGALLVISIPASDTPSGPDGAGGSDLEVGGPNGQKALERLQNVVRRIAHPWRPATGEESFEIVRRRLFEAPDAAAQRDISAVARRFVEFYAQHRGEFPRGCGEIAYEERIRRAYPIHPELFDRLYEDWSTLDRFQRTRGVLRMVSKVVHELWKQQDASPLIMPGSVPLSLNTVSGELTQYLPDAWKPIIDADIDGDGSTPVDVDRQRRTFGERALTRRIARTIFVGSAPTLHGPHKGIERQHVWLGVAVPGDTVGNFGSALEVLGQRATYLYVDSARYWFDTQASVTRTAQDHADRLREHPEEVWAELVARLGKERRTPGEFAAVHACPDDSGSVPDTEEAKLVILRPQHVHVRNGDDSAAMRFAKQCLETRGSAQRTNRNTVIFLAPDERRMEELDEAVRDLLAWRHICERTTELNLPPQQAAMAERRRDNADDTVNLRIAGAYIWALVPDQPDPAGPITWRTFKAESAQPGLGPRVTAKLRQEGLLTSTYASRNIRMELDGPLQPIWSQGHIAVGDLWSYYCRYPYLARLRDRSVLDDAIRSVSNTNTWELEGFALASGFDEASGRYEGLAIPHEDSLGQITDATLLVLPEIARRQQQADQAATAAGSVATGGSVAGTDRVGGSTSVPAGGADSVTAPAAEPPRAGNVRFFGAVQLNPERYGRDLSQVAQEVLQHLAAVDGAQLQIRVEINAVKPDGFPDDTVRIVTENARTLKFEPFGFENE